MKCDGFSRAGAGRKNRCLPEYLDQRIPDLSAWERIVRRVKEPAGVATIAIVGKYVGLTESYKSLAEALTHAGLPTTVGWS